MKFPGIHLSPGALKKRQRADELTEFLIVAHSLLDEAIQAGVATEQMIAAARRQMADAEAILVGIEMEITVL